MSGFFPRPFVLLVDDSEDDVYFFSRALRGAGFAGELRHLGDGAAAVAFLRRLGSDAPVPDLVFLDLKMPRLSGFEVLAWVRDQPALPPLDIAVLSGSEDAADVARAKQLGASAYFVKPISVARLKARLDAWAPTATLAAAPAASRTP